MLHFLLSITDPSAAPQNVRTMVLSSTSISVFWDPPPFLDQNGVITGYQVTITNVNRTNVSTVVNVANTSHIALDLQEFEAYDIEVAAMTAVGLGPFSVAVRRQTLEDSKCFTSELICNCHCFKYIQQNYEIGCSLQKPGLKVLKSKVVAKK